MVLLGSYLIGGVGLIGLAFTQDLVAFYALDVPHLTRPQRWQEAGDLVGVATLGSCSKGVSPKALRYLLGCRWLLVAYDVATEGDKGAERLEQLSPRLQRIRLPVGKDVTDFWQAGGRVRDWVRFEMAPLCAVARAG